MNINHYSERFTVGLDTSSSQRILREATLLGLPQSVLIRNYVKKGFLFENSNPGTKLL